MDLKMVEKELENVKINNGKKCRLKKLMKIRI